MRTQSSLPLVQSSHHYHTTSYNWAIRRCRGQGRPGNAAGKGGDGVAGHYPRLRQSTVSAVEGGRAREKREGRPRGGERDAGGTPGLVWAPAQPQQPALRLRQPWGGGSTRCGRCWRRCCCRCCCRRGRFPGRTAPSPAAARQTAPCAAPAHGPASPYCEYAAPRSGTLARSSLRATLLPYSLAPLTWKLGKKRLRPVKLHHLLE